MKRCRQTHIIPACKHTGIKKKMATKTCRKQMVDTYFHKSYIKAPVRNESFSIVAPTMWNALPLYLNKCVHFFFLNNISCVHCSAL